MSRVCVFCAVSLDGFIARADHGLDWLTPPPGEALEDTFGPFLAGVGALLMGRTTFDVVTSFGPEAWAYGDRPVLVATHRPLDATRPTVRPVAGPIAALVAEARAAAGPGDVYLDGGQMVGQALAAGLVDEVTLTVVPVALGAGIAAFGGHPTPRPLGLLGARPLGAGFVELRYGAG
ncbi:MAG: dihydrofolate reductase family protein [Candidatus Sericytochromatia bacterium]|nr:dihydrofolate reductase family protein [Candidatus Sericytochromatia bacterium]